MQTYRVTRDDEVLYERTSDAVPPELRDILEPPDRPSVPRISLTVVFLAPTAIERFGERCPKVGETFETVRDAAKALAVSRQALYNAMSRGDPDECSLYGVHFLVRRDHVREKLVLRRSISPLRVKLNSLLPTLELGCQVVIDSSESREGPLRTMVSRIADSLNKGFRVQKTKDDYRITRTK